MSLFDINPRFNEASLRIVHTREKSVFVYGGIPWPENPDQYSPTRLPVTDFFKFRLEAKDYGAWSVVETFADARVRFPFAENAEDSSSRDSTPSQQEPRPLPCLAHHMGALYTDASTRNAYLIIFGGLRLKTFDPRPASSTSKNDQRQLTEIYLSDSDIQLFSGSGLVEPSTKVICVNLKTNSWRTICLINEKSIEKRIGGVAVILGTHMFVFGGLVQQKSRKRLTGLSMEYATTYAVLDIRNHRWTEPALQLPTNMPVLGENPVATVYMNAVGQEYVVILSGTQQTIEANFASVYVFNADEHIFSAMINLGNDVPSALERYTLQAVPIIARLDAADHSKLEACPDLVILCGWANINFDHQSGEVSSDSEGESDKDGDSAYSGDVDNSFDSAAGRKSRARGLCIWELDLDEQKWKKIQDRETLKKLRRMEVILQVGIVVAFTSGFGSSSSALTGDETGWNDSDELEVDEIDRVSLHFLGCYDGPSRLPIGRVYNCHEQVVLYPLGGDDEGDDIGNAAEDSGDEEEEELTYLSE